MAWQAPEGMDEYLKPTEFCDCENERVKDNAHELIQGRRDSKRGGHADIPFCEGRNTLRC